MQANSLKNANHHCLGLVQSHTFHLPTITYAHLIMGFSTWKTGFYAYTLVGRGKKG
jgi:hypothetical protein